MPGSTLNINLPYPLGGETADPASDIKSLAEAMDAKHAAHLAENTQYKTTNDANILALQNNKADKTEVNSLATAKADKTYVDTQMASVASGSPKGTYATLTDLQTAFPTGNTNIYVVTADGKWYYWSGSAWTAGGVYQSTGIAGGAVTPEKTSFITFHPDKNILIPVPGIYTQDGATITIDGDGNIVLSGTSSTTFIITIPLVYPLYLTNGKRYLLSTQNAITTIESVFARVLKSGATAFDAPIKTTGTGYVASVVVDGTYTSDVLSFIIRIPASIALNGISFNVQLEEISVAGPPTAYEKAQLKYYLSDSILRLESDAIKLLGKLGVGFGDSIMQGAGNSGVGILDILSQKYGNTVRDYSAGGATVGYVSGSPHIVAQIQQCITDSLSPDFIVMNGGINDVSAGIIGSLVDYDYGYVAGGFADFTKGLEYCFGLLKTNFPSVPIVYIWPHHMPSRDQVDQISFRDRALKICEKWSVDCVDMYKDGGMNTMLTNHLQNYSYYPTEATGTHPNSTGYNNFYIPRIINRLSKVL